MRVYFFSIFSLWFASQLIPGFKITGSLPTLFGAAFALFLLTLIVKPVLKILFIPVNLITFGLLSWIVNVIMIYLLTVVVPEVRIMPWVFPGTSMMGFVIPKLDVTYHASLILSSVLITFVSNLLHGVSES